MDRDLWISIGLFAVGVVAFGAGYALVLDTEIAYLPGVGLTLAGGALLGLSGAVAFRRQTGVVSRRRVLALMGTFLGVAVGSIGMTPFLRTGDVANLAFLVWFLPAIVYWIHRRDRETKVNQTDERMQLLAYRAAAWMLSVIVLLAGGLLWAELFGLDLPSTRTILAAVGGIGLFGWYGSYRYLQTHN
ncbi:MAG: hypothetical protein ABEI98_03480 [Halorhabdus sp.]